MDLLGESGLRRVVPISTLKKLGGYRRLEFLASTINDKSCEWRAETKKKIIYVRYYSHTLAVGIDETDIGAQTNPMVIGGYQYGFGEPQIPSTSQIISFMHWKINSDQIIEFFDF